MRAWIMKLILGKWLKPIWDFLNGNKTYLGIVQIVLGIAIWVVPEISSELGYIAEFAKQIANLMGTAGIDLGTVLTSGAGFTLVGLVHKIIKLFTKTKDKND